MKINLLRNSNSVLNGYVNLDNFPGDNKTQCDVANLDAAVDDGFATEIIANNILEYYEVAKVNLILQNWVKKLRHGGIITVVTSDYRTVCRSVARDVISFDEALAFLFGTQETPLLCKKSALSCDSLKGMLMSLGLKIVAIKLENYEICITAERP